MHQTLKIIAALSAILFAQSSFAGFQEGVNAYAEKDFKAALEEFQPLAKNSDAKSQYYLGWVYLSLPDEDGYTGDAKQDEEIAMQWFTKAARNGNSDAQLSLRNMIYSKLNISQATQKYLADAKKGDVLAMAALGDAYLKAASISEKPQPEYFPRALQWIQKAADQGYAFSQEELGSMYRGGLGVQTDYKIAMDWYRKAATQGNYEALSSISNMYGASEGVTASRVIVDVLNRLSFIHDAYDPSAIGDAHPLDADDAARPLENTMSSQEIAAARTLINEMAKPGNLLNALDQYALHPTAIELPFYSPANGKVSLCTDDEIILLSCVTKTRLISVCASKNQSEAKRYIQYRVEKGGKLEFEFPKEKVLPSKAFTFDSGNGTIGGYTALGFKSGEYFYQVVHSWDKYNEDDFGVDVSRNGKTISNLLCQDKVISNWFTDGSVVIDDLPKHTPH